MSKKKPANKQQSAGGRKGAKRWANVSPEERDSIMKAAAEARWGPKKTATPKKLFAAGLAQVRWSKLTPEERKEELARVRDWKTQDQRVS